MSKIKQLTGNISVYENTNNQFLNSFQLKTAEGEVLSINFKISEENVEIDTFQLIEKDGNAGYRVFIKNHGWECLNSDFKHVPQTDTRVVKGTHTQSKGYVDHIKAGGSAHLFKNLGIGVPNLHQATG